MTKWAFLATAVLGMAASGETFTWKPTANALNYRFQDNANWEGGVAPARDGGHDIDMTADTAQLSNGRVGQSIEHISVPYEAISFGTFEGRYGRWLEWNHALINIPACTLSNPNEFYGLWVMKLPWTVTLGATAGFTPVIQRFTQKGAVTLDVPTAGTVAIVSNVVQSGSIGKSGAGKLVIARPGGNSGGLNVQGGTVEVEGSRRFTDEEMAAVMAKAAFHVDASMATTLRTNAEGRVDRWYDVRGQSGYSCGQTFSQNGYTLPMPKIARGYQNGLDVLDFGPLAANYADAVASGESCTLGFSDSLWYNNGHYILEAFVVEGQHDADAGKACFFGASNDKGFRRYRDSVLVSSDGTADSVNATTRNLNSRDGDFAINGVKVLPTTVITSSAIKVYSFRARENAYVRINCWGADYGTNPGGLRIGEALYFTNFLSYAERKNIIRHLSEKWGCADDGAEDAYDLGWMHDSTGATAFNAPKDLAVRDILWSGATFEKTGAGTLEAGAVRDPSTGNAKAVTVSGGTLKFGPLVKPSANPQPAAGSYRHYDASDLTSLTYADDGNGNLNVSEWRDQSGDASKTASRIPSTVPRGTYALGHPRLTDNGPNGMPIIDFGPRFNLGGGTDCGEDSGAMCFDPAAGDVTDNANFRLRTGFLVFRRTTNNENSWVLGATSNVNAGCNFHPNTGGILISAKYGSPYLIGGETTRDGLRFDVRTAYTDWDQWHLVRFSATGNLYANDFGLDRGGEMPGSVGGFALGEVIFYDRPLSRQETIDTEAYLMKKWLDKAHPNEKTGEIGSSTIGAAATPEVDTAADIVVSNLSVAAESFTKKGPGRFATEAIAANVRSVDVQDGELVLPFDPVPPLYRIDASKPDTLTTFTTDNGNGTVRTNIVSWADVRGNGPVANTFLFKGETPTEPGITVTNPALIAIATRSGVVRPAVDFGLYKSNGISSADDGTTSGMLFDRNFSTVREVFTIHADRSSGNQQFLFGHSSLYNYHRNGAKLFRDTYSGLNNEPNHIIRVNGESATYNTELAAGTFYLVNVARDKNTSINQIALDRRMDSSRAGGMYCCEQIAYPTRLSDARRDFMNRHLMYKWFGEGERPVWTNTTLDAVSVAAGATLTTAPEDALALDSLSGNGHVKNGGVVFKAGATWSLTPVADLADAAHIDGTVGAVGALTLAVTVPDDFPMAEGDWPLACVGGLDIARENVTLALSRAIGKTARLRYADGVLFLNLAPKGTALLFR